MLQIDVGDNSATQSDTIPVTVPPGGSVVLTNLAASIGSVLYYLNGLDGGSSTLTPGSNVTLTSSTWIQPSGGIATVTLVGGPY